MAICGVSICVRVAAERMRLASKGFEKEGEAVSGGSHGAGGGSLDAVSGAEEFAGGVA